MTQYFGCAEVIVDGDHRSMRFFAPTRRKWVTQLKLGAYKAWHSGDGTRVETRIVTPERAQQLLVDYTEWLLRRQIAGA